jgi:mevalonate kinase
MPQFAPVGEQVPLNPVIAEQERIAKEKKEKQLAEERAAKALAKGTGGGGGGSSRATASTADADESSAATVKKEPVFQRSSTHQKGEFDDDEQIDLVSLRMFVSPAIGPSQ